MRVQLDLAASTGGDSGDEMVIQSPIRAVLDRQTSLTSTSGTRADGGGLDGRTVSTLLGDRLRSAKTFAEWEPLPIPKENSSSITTLSSSISIPGNIAISHGTSSSGKPTLVVSHVEGSTRRVVSRILEFPKEEEPVSLRTAATKCWEEAL